MSGATALLFPGQGAHYAGMGRAAFARCPAARAVFDEADAVLGFSLSTLCFEGPDDELRQTRRQQPAILVTSLALLAAGRGALPHDGRRFATGHSLGLFTALVAAEALALGDAVRLVARRGELMQDVSDRCRGGMSAVLGLDDVVVEEVCRRLSPDGASLVAANYNAPGQVVISGCRELLEQAAAELRSAGARKVVALPVAGPFHSPLMQPAADTFRPALDAVSLRQPAYPIVANTSPRLLADPDTIREELQAQVTAPVRWTAAMRLLVEENVDSFVDCGPGATLAALQRRIAPERAIIRFDG